jgi:hypothetical protein
MATSVAKNMSEKGYYFFSAPPVHQFCYIFSSSDWGTDGADFFFFLTAPPA